MKTSADLLHKIFTLPESHFEISIAMRNSLKLRKPFPSVSNILINCLVKPSTFPNFININFYLNFSSHNIIKGKIILLLIFTGYQKECVLSFMISYNNS